MALLTYRYEMYLGGAWVNITSYVRDTSPVTVKRGTGDWSTKAQPALAKFVLENKDDRFNPRNPTGPYFGNLRRNVPVRVFAVVGGVDYSRFYGEVYSFEPRWNENRSNCFVSIEANGVLRRIFRNKQPARSAHRSWFNARTSNPYPRYYWTLEEPPGAEEALPDIGVGPARFLDPAPTQAKTWGAAAMNDWYPNGVQIPRLAGIRFPADMRGYSTTNGWEMTAVLTLDKDESTLAFEVNCGVNTLWVVAYVAFGTTNGTLQVIGPNGTVDTSPFTIPDAKDAGPIWLTFRMSYGGGFTVGYVAWAPVGQASNSISIETAYSITSSSLELPRYVNAWNATSTPGSNATVGLSNVSFSGSQTSTSGMGNSFSGATKGFIDEGGQARFTRLSDDLGVPTNTLDGGMGFVTMHRQPVQSYEDHVNEILASGDGFVLESRSTGDLLLNGGLFRTAPYKDVTVVNYTEVVDDIEPAEDDQLTANQVTVTNANTGTATLRKTSGSMSVANIGTFAGESKTNNRLHSQAVSVGHLKLNRGTQDTPRVPSLTVSGRSTPSRYADFLNVEVGEFLSLEGFSPAGYYNPLVVRVLGIEETITQSDHLITFNVAPDLITYRPYRVLPASGDLTYSALEGDGSTTTSLVNSTATSLPVTNVTSSWTTASGNWPFDILVAGERMTVTTVSAPSGLSQTLFVTRSVNGVVKSIPAGSAIELYPGNYLGTF